MSYVIGFLAFIFILGAAVVIHEFGHFAVAKLLKIRVETFSFGFGPRLLGKRWGHTDYRVSLIPLGGYVKLGGDESNAPIEGSGASDIPPEEQFNLRPKWQRILVAIAGPVMNILTAIAIPFIGGLIFGVPATPTSVISRVDTGGAAQVAGLQPGDRIISFNGNDNPSWDVIRGDALLSPDQPLPMVVERNGQRLQVTIKPTKRVEGGETIGDVDFMPDYGTVPVVVRSVEAGSPVATAGLQAGDRIMALNGEEARNSEQVRQFIKDHKAEPIRMTVERGGVRKEITASVGKLADGSEGLGLVPVDNMPLEKAGPGSAARYAVNANIEILRLTGKALGQFFSGQRSAKDTLSGPIGIARASSTAANVGGWGGVFTMLAFLSLSLGVFNLLPIPVLDGGAIFLLLIEAVLGWIGVKLTITMRERIQQVGFVMLLLLMGLVIFNDVSKEFSRWGSKSDDKPAASAPSPPQQK